MVDEQNRLLGLITKQNLSVLLKRNCWVEENSDAGNEKFMIKRDSVLSLDAESNKDNFNSHRTVASGG